LFFLQGTLIGNRFFPPFQTLFFPLQNEKLRQDVLEEKNDDESSSSKSKKIIGSRKSKVGIPFSNKHVLLSFLSSLFLSLSFFFLSLLSLCLSFALSLRADQEVFESTGRDEKKTADQRD